MFLFTVSIVVLEKTMTKRMRIMIETIPPTRVR